MAIVTKFLLGVSTLLAIVRAAPVVVTVTDTVTVTEWQTVNSTSTVWEYGPASATIATISTSTEALAVSTSAVVQVQQTAAAVVAPSSTPAVFVQQPVSITTTSFVVPATTTLQTSAIPRSAQVAPAVAGGTCEGSGSPCTGDVTHWDGGLGACGWSVNTASDMQIALPVGLMGSQSNGNPYCGRNVTLLNPTTGVTMQATVGDKCMGCVGTSIDLTDVLFAAVTGNGDGRVSGIQWWFT